jgi:hypothetical protein
MKKITAGKKNFDLELEETAIKFVYCLAMMQAFVAEVHDKKLSKKHLIALINFLQKQYNRFAPRRDEPKIKKYLSLVDKRIKKAIKNGKSFGVDVSYKLKKND